MNDYDKKEFLMEIELFFLDAKNDEGLPVPYSKQGIIDSINKVGWDYLKEHWNKAQEEGETKESIDVLFDFSNKVVLYEVTEVAHELEKEGKLRSGVDKNGDIAFFIVEKEN